uniref:Ribosomal protein S3 n=1 Tax=Sarcopeltis skottsbergii TaxID=2765380 RepID=A0A7M1VIB1_SARSK|nr:ribosomal protein S3 [Sarcopeltis skottsbergii]QOS04457.1 ribosomal protein S3 [Sarcopeltis skottsbergii]
MAQKINPISFRLGTAQVWSSTLQIYGKSFKSYFPIVNNQLKLHNFLSRYFQLNDFQLNYYEWKMYKNKTLLNIYFSPSFTNKNINLIFLKKLFVLFSKWFPSDFFVYFHLNLKWALSPKFLLLYAKYLLLQKTPPKKIMRSLCKFLLDQLNSTKITYFKFGLHKTKLVGFKIRLAGRFEGSNQMAKIFEQTVDHLSLTNLSSFVEYSTAEIHTKLGTCGIQIWLFYSPKKYLNDCT